MSVLRLLGFARLGCGCLIGRYHEVAVDRKVAYIEAKDRRCRCTDHRQHQPVLVTRLVTSRTAAPTISAAS